MVDKSFWPVIHTDYGLIGMDLAAESQDPWPQSIVWVDLESI